MSTDERLEIVLKTIGNSEVIDTIGKSKLGITYLVDHQNLGKCVLKLLKEDIFITRKFFKSLKRYNEIINEVAYPGIAKVYKISEEPFPYLFREYCPGISLEEQIAEGLSPLEATMWMEKLALALQAAYNFGVSHKNLKPTNIFINNTTKKLRIVDFCLPASLSFYLSPEHCNNNKRDYRSDIYSLGTIYYQTLTGDVPFQGRFREVKKMHLENEWPSIPEIPREIDRILVKSSAKNPEERYPSFLSLVGELRNAKKLFTDKHKGVNTKITFAMPKIQRTEDVEDPESPIAEDNEVSILEEETLYNYRPKDLDLSNKEYHISDSLPIVNAEDLNMIKLEEQEDFLEGMEPHDFSLPETVSKTLKYITDTRDIIRNGKTLNHLSLNYAKQHNDVVLDYLLQIIRRECWTIKNISNSEELQIIVDLAEAKTFRYYNHFDDQIRNALKKLPQKSSINKTFFTQQGASSSHSISKSKSHASFFSILDTIISLKEDEVKVYDEDNVETYTPKEKPVEASTNENLDNNWLNVDDEIGENIRKASNDGKESENKKEDYPTEIELNINLGNRYQARAWFKMIKENSLEKGKHFILKDSKDLRKSCFQINLLELSEYQKQQEGLSSVKAFFQADYHIERLDHGGMATVLKLITKNEITIIFLRPENHWARDYFAENLRIRKTKDGKEGVYAEMPKDSVVVVKVAFEGREEALIYESRLLSKLAEAKNIRKYIIGMIQEGSFLAASADSQITEERVGYYLMLEYASHGNIEQFSKNFPFHRLPPSIAFNVLYSMVVTLQFLKSQGIIHRDIKPQNILMSNNMIPKLGDFGLAITVDEAGSKLNDERRRLLKLVDQEFLHISSEKEQCESRLQRLQTNIKKLSYPDDFDKFELISTQITTLKSQLESLVSQELERANDLKKRYRPMSAEEIAIKGEFAGSMIYAAPEQFSPSKILTCDCDIYQLGAVAYTMLTGKPPVQGKNISAIMSEIILSHKPKVSEEIKDSGVVEALSDIVYDMMTNDVVKRISVDEVRKQLEKVLLNYYNDLQETPYYQAPKNMEEDEKEKWQEQVMFSQEAHNESTTYLKEWYDILKEEELLIEKQKQEKEGAEIITLWWEGNKIPKSFRFRCPGCTKNLKMPSEIIGKKIRCPHCQSMLMAKRFS